MSLKKNHHEILYYLLIKAWILTMVSYALAYSLWDAMVVQGNDRSLRPSISRPMRHILRNVKDCHDGMVSSYLFCRQVQIRACEPLTLTKPISVVLFANWSVNTYNKWFHIHLHVFCEMRWFSKLMVVYLIHPFQGIWGILKGTKRIVMMGWYCFIDSGMHATIFNKANKSNMDTKEQSHIFLLSLLVKCL